MKRSRPMLPSVPDAATLRVWEDMRADVLHELQEGAEEPDELIDAMGELVAALSSTHPLPSRPPARDPG